jgi:hypothetical protein
MIANGNTVRSCDRNPLHHLYVNSTQWVHGLVHGMMIGP